MQVLRIDHVQLAIPPGGEEQARAFFRDLLGIPEREKPASLAAHGGVWFERGDLKVHAGVEKDFRPAAKAHPALQVEGLNELVARLRAADVKIVEDEPLAGYSQRVFVFDPFGNRIELLEPSPAERAALRAQPG
jgi:catechol 2,3-dioxygenase-like lactoylglutathione lyase family enzyme